MKKHFHIHIKAHNLSHAGILSKVWRDPFVDWFFILLISFIFSGAFIWIGVSMFLSINSDAVGAADQSSAPTVGGTLDKPDLAKLVASFEDKQAKTAFYEKSYQGPPDPSASSTAR